MIEILSGILKIKHPTFAVIDCNGVGFGVQISTRTGESLPEIGVQVSLFTHLVVREDSLTLFGFSEIAEKELFLKMIDVNGIGPKMAQRILSSVSPSSFLDMIAREDKNALSKIKGIGKKTVEQLIISFFLTLMHHHFQIISGSIYLMRRILAALRALCSSSGRVAGCPCEISTFRCSFKLSDTLVALTPSSSK